MHLDDYEEEPYVICKIPLSTVEGTLQMCSCLMHEGENQPDFQKLLTLCDEAAIKSVENQTIENKALYLGYKNSLSILANLTEQPEILKEIQINMVERQKAFEKNLN